MRPCSLPISCMMWLHMAYVHMYMYVYVGARSVTAYFPEGVWYEFYNLTATTKTGKTWIQLDAPLDRVPVCMFVWVHSCMHTHAHMSVRIRARECDWVMCQCVCIMWVYVYDCVSLQMESMCVEGTEG